MASKEEMPFTFSLSLNVIDCFNCGTRIEIGGELVVVTHIKSVRRVRNLLEIKGICRKVNKKPAE